jgi:hypothetical protein
LTEEQRRQTTFSAKTLRAAGLLPVASVGSVVTARCGDAPTLPPWPQPKSLAAAPLVILKQALKNKHLLVIYSIPTRGFTAVVSVFRGTPPTKPLIAKNRVLHRSAAFDRSWAHLVGGQPKLACFKFALAPGDII